MKKFLSKSSVKGKTWFQLSEKNKYEFGKLWGIQVKTSMAFNFIKKQQEFKTTTS